MTNDNWRHGDSAEQSFACGKIAGREKGRTSSARLAKLLEALLDVGHDVRVCAKGELGVGNAGRGSNSRAMERRSQYLLLSVCNRLDYVC